ncbi:MAG: TlpA disulfide reductase family protein, partial [Cyclobacteriaceae bacterium]
ATNSASEEFTGKYSVTFVHEGDTTVAVGIFNQDGNQVTGTFLTPIGDYRYLQGNVVDGQMMLSTFDGNHAFVFKAKKENDSTLVGDFWSGKSWHESWIGIKNDNAALPDADSLTFLKEGYDKIEFTFPDVNGEMVSLTDDRFKDKVVILQIFGTWCPNCMDETKFLSQWYSKNRDKDVEILGLAYEAKDDFDYASGRVKKMKEKLDVPYDFVIAGNKDKEEAAKTLPMLNHVLSFPTTIFIGKDGTVKRIHTGFSGPGTGIYYERFIAQFNKTVGELLTDNLASIQ